MSTVTDPQPRAAVRDDPLVARAFDARGLALQRLIEVRSPEGNWPLPIDLNAILGATYIIMLRTTGLIEESGAFEREASLLRRMIQQVNPDGGFYKFATSPSSKCLSRVCVASLRLALGEVAPGHRPASWFRRNPSLDGALESRLRSTLERAEHFVAHGQPGTRREFEAELRPIAPLLVAHADSSRPRSVLHPFSPRLAAWVLRSRTVSAFCRSFCYPTRKMWPALSILHAMAGSRARSGVEGQRTSDGQEGARRGWRAAVGQLAQHIRHDQNQQGGWAINSFYTAMNMMAVAAAGAAPDDPCIQKAHAHLLGDVHGCVDGAAFVDGFRSDVANTGYGVDSLLRAAGRGVRSALVRPSIDFLLARQGRDGSYAWGSGSRNGADADTTAHALRGLAQAAPSAEGALRQRVMAALGRGVAFTLSRQSRDGGFSCWDTTFVRARPGSLSVVKQLLFDVPTADVTARIVEVLTTVGLGIEHPAVRRALRFLLRTQSANGSWWSHWWAGYLPGASFALRAYGKLGLRWAQEPVVDDGLLVRSHHAMTFPAWFHLVCHIASHVHQVSPSVVVDIPCPTQKA